MLIPLCTPSRLNHITLVLSYVSQQQLTNHHIFIACCDRTKAICFGICNTTMRQRRRRQRWRWRKTMPKMLMTMLLVTTLMTMTTCTLKASCVCSLLNKTLRVHVFTSCGDIIDKTATRIVRVYHIMELQVVMIISCRACERKELRRVFLSTTLAVRRAHAFLSSIEHIVAQETCRYDGEMLRIVSQWHDRLKSRCREDVRCRSEHAFTLLAWRFPLGSSVHCGWRVCSSQSCLCEQSRRYQPIPCR